MRLLTAIFSYNRFELLGNCTDSWWEMGPGGDLLIIDDGSNDPRMGGLLEREERRGARVIRVPRGPTLFHGGLYTNMSLALEQAIVGGYDYIYFLQDDVQFMHPVMSRMGEYAQLFEAHPGVGMIGFMFYKGIMRRTIKPRLEWEPALHAWHCRPYGIADIGLARVGTFREAGFRFLDSEGANSAFWLDRGYKYYIHSLPHLAFVPWPMTIAFDRSYGQERKRRRPYFLKPLDQDQITRLEKTASRQALAFHEDFCSPWGWTCLKPYWFTGLNREYLRLVIKSRWFPHPTRAD
ncbi:MAG: glycosyltransferase family A protein [Verrucomicrobiae bacterium]|nr:glycosyltransferase family A protein [Verrucomicrobiae bacterium]